MTEPLKKRRETAAICLYVLLLFCAFSLLGYFCVWTHDDYLTFTGSFSELMRDTLYFGNGRYLGNLIVNPCLLNKPLDAAVRGAVITGIVVLLASVPAKLNCRTLSLSLLLFAGFGNLIFREAIVWGHGFYNFAPPVLLILLALQILKNCYTGNGTGLTAPRCVLLGLIGVCQQLFSENTTCIAAVIAITVAVFVLRGKMRKGPALVYLLGTLVGAFIMFALPEIMQVSYKMADYRGSGVGAPTLQAFAAQFASNACVCLKTFVGMFGVWPVVSYALIRSVGSQVKNGRRLKGRPVLYLIFALQPVCSFIFYFVNEKTLRERIPLTSVRIPDLSSKIVFALCVFFVVFLLSAIIVLYKDPVIRQNRAAAFTVLAVFALSVGELLIITVMGPRCLFLSACILAFFIVLYTDRGGLLKTRFAVCTGTCGVGLLLAVLLTLHHAWQVNNARDAYAKEQLAEGKEIIEIIMLPHAEWFHCPNQSAGYGYYYNYGEVKPEEDYTYITYAEYLKKRPAAAGLTDQTASAPDNR